MLEQNSSVVSQYRQFKQGHKDCILCFRIGEFYEMFYDDALIISKLFGLVISYKTKEKVPMCGFPKASLEVYVYRIMLNGYKVAVCDEILQDGKIHRKITRVYTKGTMIEENFLDAKSGNFILAYLESAEPTYATMDISTGDVYIGSGPISLHNLIMLWDPVECLSEKRLLGSSTWSSLPQYHDRFSFFDFAEAETYQRSAEVLYPREITISLSKNELFCIGLIVKYAKYAQNEDMRHIKKPQRWDFSDKMQLDSFTVRNLEIFQILEGEKQGSLYNVINRTNTSAGSRLLRHRLQSPLRNINTINDRLDSIEYFINNRSINNKMRLSDDLRSFADLERVVARVNFNQHILRDLVNSINSLSAYVRITSYLPEKGLSYELRQSLSMGAPAEELLKKMQAAFNLNSSLEFGNLIKTGYDSDLDELKNKKAWITAQLEELKKQYALTVKVNLTNIKYSESIGFYVETSKSKASFVPYSFSKIQELSGSFRFTTPELEEISKGFTLVQYQILKREKFLFDEFMGLILANRLLLVSISQAMGIVDLSYSMAEMAIRGKHVRPEIVEENVFEVRKGSNIILERYKYEVRKNDCILTPPMNGMLITGSNMSGKTTYLKQNALIALMAHVGLFVPAEKAVIGLTDAIFVRIGANDNMRNGMSTFMVEMHELAIILNSATKKSLIMIDEIGRGTDAAEGLNIACAVVSYLLETEIRNMFATHYSKVACIIKGLQEVQMLVECNPLRFLYEIAPGRPTKSYAIDIGRMAGVPNKILEKAEEVRAWC